MIEKIVNVERVEDLIAVFGSFDENIRRIEDALGVNIVNRGNELKIVGDAEGVDKAARTLEGLLTIAARGEVIDEQRVRYLLTLVQEGNDDQVSKIAKDVVCISAKGKPIKAKTVGQQNYMKAIQKNTITIGVGPAGTGKTYLAVAAAVQAFRDKQVNRIILTRPAVEAGERLGFLPGDLQSKVDPYLRPLYDAMFEMMGAENYQRLLEKGVKPQVVLGFGSESKSRDNCQHHKYAEQYRKRFLEYLFHTGTSKLYIYRYIIIAINKFLMHTIRLSIFKFTNYIMIIFIVKNTFTMRSPVFNLTNINLTINKYSNITCSGFI